MASHPLALGQFIPSPPISGFHIGPLFVHFYGLMYVVGIALAIYITRRRLAVAGGNPDLVYDVAYWGVPAGLIGARIYFDITTPFDIVPKPCFAGLLGDVCPPGHQWWGPLAIWNGGQGLWGGIVAGALVGAWRVRRAGGNVGVFMDAVAPALLVAQAIVRIGNYFDQQLFGKPSTLPWAVQVSRAARLHGGIPTADLRFSTFQPSFLYELIFDLALAAGLVWLGHHRSIRPPGLFALYVAGYSGYRVFEETIRIDSSAHFLGLRLNFFVAVVMTLVGLAWFAISQRRSRAVTNGAAVLAIVGTLGACAAGCSRAGQHLQADVSQRHAMAVLAPGRMAPRSCAGRTQAAAASAGVGSLLIMRPSEDHDLKAAGVLITASRQHQSPAPPPAAARAASSHAQLPDCDTITANFEDPHSWAVASMTSRREARTSGVLAQGPISNSATGIMKRHQCRGSSRTSGGRRARR